MIPVTKPFLPPLEEFTSHLEEIWRTGWVTNLGPKTKELEARLTQRADTPALYVSNGTLALNVAARAFDLRGDVLTTPFTFVATASSMAWEGCTPRFVDIHPETYNLDPDLLEEALTPETTAVVATHVYGNPCDHERISSFCDAHGLTLVYDAAHAFGATYKGRPLLSFGHISTCSFQATKLFHTAEGGAVFCADASRLERVRSLRDFGGRFPPNQYEEPGINAKNSEVHAALGLSILAHMDEVLDTRRRQGERYRDALRDVVQLQRIMPETSYNHAYVPVAFRDEAELLRAIENLGSIDAHPRRYFHPSLSAVTWAPPANTPVADDLSSRVLCLPVFHHLPDEDIDRVCEVVASSVRANRSRPC